jgi:hypothetical protein
MLEMGVLTSPTTVEFELDSLDHLSIFNLPFQNLYTNKSDLSGTRNVSDNPFSAKQTGKVRRCRSHVRLGASKAAHRR